MKGKTVRFAGPWTVEFANLDVAPETAGPNSVMVRTEASIVSAGTEMAILSGG